jgi:hypothetical protein
MRRTVAFALLLSLAHAGPAIEAPTCRCVLAAQPEGLRTLDETGVTELDKRVRSEMAFLKNLYQAEARIVFIDGVPARKAFTVADEGGGTIFVSAQWLKDVWTEDNRVATVASILAHQYAHVVQAKRKCPLPEWSREQQADLLAGWYLGRRNIATLGGGADLDAPFAASLFAEADDYLNAPLDHGAPELRAKAMRDGFRLFRDEKLPIDKIYRKGLTAFPPPKEGIVDGAVKPEGDLVRVKVPCTHMGPCNHHVACQHPQPCVHKVACTHAAPCVHRTPCVHRVACSHHVPCVHRMPCVHRVSCKHHVPCVHTVPCTHYDSNGNPLHAFDYLHNFDYEHEYDLEHEYDHQHDYDTEHEYDVPHEFDTEHPFDPVHEFDWAHDWDPIHEFDLAHESDPVHDYDVKYVPAAEAEGAPGGG